MPWGYKNSNNCRVWRATKGLFHSHLSRKWMFLLLLLFLSSLLSPCSKSKSVSLKWNQKLTFRSPVFPLLPLSLSLIQCHPASQVFFFFFDNLFILLLVFYTLFTFVFFARKTCDLNFELIRSIIYIFFSNVPPPFVCFIDLPLIFLSLSLSLVFLYFPSFLYYLFICEWFSGIAGSYLL